MKKGTSSQGILQYYEDHNEQFCAYTFENVDGMDTYLGGVGTTPKWTQEAIENWNNPISILNSEFAI